MERLNQVRHKGKAQQRQLPYDPLAVRCPKCGAYSETPCKSATGGAIRHPHRERAELAASEFRSDARLAILESIRRGPFALAFSPRRMAVDGFDRRTPPAALAGVS